MYSRYRRFVCNILSSTVRSIRYGLVVAQTERRRRPETNTTQTHPNVVKYTGSFLSASSVLHILHIDVSWMYAKAPLYTKLYGTASLISLNVALPKMCVRLSYVGSGRNAQNTLGMHLLPSPQ